MYKNAFKFFFSCGARATLLHTTLLHAYIQPTDGHRDITTAVACMLTYEWLRSTRTRTCTIVCMQMHVCVVCNCINNSDIPTRGFSQSWTFCWRWVHAVGAPTEDIIMTASVYVVIGLGRIINMHLSRTHECKQYAHYGYYKTLLYAVQYMSLH